MELGKERGQGYIDPQGKVLSLKYTVSANFLAAFSFDLEKCIKCMSVLFSCIFLTRHHKSKVVHRFDKLFWITLSSPTMYSIQAYCFEMIFIGHRTVSAPFKSVQPISCIISFTKHFFSECGIFKFFCR